MRALVAAQLDATIDELRARLADEGIAVGRSSVDIFQRALGLTRKKTIHAAEQERPDIAAARAPRWRWATACGTH